MGVSYIILGGWDGQDYSGEIAWLDAKKSWNQTLTEFTMDGETIINQYELAPVMFETGYPYIGLSPDYYDKVAKILKKKVYSMECMKGSKWGICRVKDQYCERLPIQTELVFTIDEYSFKIPLENIAVYVKQ